MSGHKKPRRTLQQGSLSKVSEDDLLLQQVERDFQEIKDHIEQTRLEGYKLSYDQLLNQQDELDQALIGLNNQFLNFADQANHSIDLQTISLDEQLQNYAIEAWDTLSSLVDRQSSDFINIHENNQANQADRFDYLSSTIQQLHEDQEERYYIANENLAYAETSFESLQKYHPHIQNRFEEMEDLRQQLDQASQNLAAGFYDAVVVTSQQVMQRLSSLKIEGETILYQRDVAFIATREKALILHDMIQSNRQVRATNLEGIELETIIDVDYWSYGLWRKANRACHNLQNYLLRSRDELSLSQVISLQERLSQIEEILYQAVSQARQNVISSQIRYNIAECAVNALSEQGYRLDFSNYEENDMRTAYYAVLRHLDGSQITIYLSPVEGQACLQTLDVNRIPPEGRSEHELRQQSREINQALLTFGLQVGKINIQPTQMDFPSSISIGTQQQDHSYSDLQPVKGQVMVSATIKSG